MSFSKNTKLVRRWKLRKRIDLTAKKTKTFQINPNRRFLNNRNRTATSYGEEEEKKKTVRMRTDTALFQGTLVLLIVFGRSASPCWSCRSCARNHRPLVSACKRTEQGAVKSSQWPHQPGNLPWLRQSSWVSFCYDSVRLFASFREVYFILSRRVALILGPREQWLIQNTQTCLES